MGRDDRRKARDKNKAKLPQTPAGEKTNNPDVEIAEEAAELYNFEVTPGFGVTGVERKDGSDRDE